MPILSLTILIAGGVVRADTLVMNSGRRIEGTIFKQTEDSVTIHVPPGAQLRMSKSDIAEIIIVPVPAPVPPPPPPPQVPAPVPVPAARISAPTNSTPVAGTAPVTSAAPVAPAPAAIATAPPPAVPTAPPASGTGPVAAVRTPSSAKTANPPKVEPAAPGAVVIHTVSRVGSLLFPYPKVEGSAAMHGLWEHSQGRPVTGATPLVLNRGDRVEVVLTNTVVYPATAARPEAKLEVVLVRIRSSGLTDLRTGRPVRMNLFEGWMLPDRLQADAP